MLLNISDRLKIRKQKGIGLLELMLAIAIISLLLLMAVRYYKAARQQQQIADTISKVNGIIAAEANWASNVSSATPYVVAQTLIDNNYLNPVAIVNPWDNSTIGVVTSGGGSAVVITLNNVSTNTVCGNLANLVQTSLGGSASGTTNASCSGSTLTVNYQ